MADAGENRVGGAAGLPCRAPVEVNPHVLPGESRASVGGRQRRARQGRRAGIVLALDACVGKPAAGVQAGSAIRAVRKRPAAWPVEAAGICFACRLAADESTRAIGASQFACLERAWSP